jgi:hypothetical protein
VHATPAQTLCHVAPWSGEALDQRLRVGVAVADVHVSGPGVDLHEVDVPVRGRLAHDAPRAPVVGRAVHPIRVRARVQRVVAPDVDVRTVVGDRVSGQRPVLESGAEHGELEHLRPRMAAVVGAVQRARGLVDARDQRPVAENGHREHARARREVGQLAPRAPLVGGGVEAVAGGRIGGARADAVRRARGVDGQHRVGRVVDDEPDSGRAERPGGVRRGERCGRRRAARLQDQPPLPAPLVDFAPHAKPPPAPS